MCLKRLMRIFMHCMNKIFCGGQYVMFILKRKCEKVVIRGNDMVFVSKVCFAQYVSNNPFHCEVSLLNLVDGLPLYGGRIPSH